MELKDLKSKVKNLCLSSENYEQIVAELSREYKLISNQDESLEYNKEYNLMEILSGKCTRLLPIKLKNNNKIIIEFNKYEKATHGYAIIINHLINNKKTILKVVDNVSIFV